MNDSIRLTQDDDGRDKTFADDGVFSLDCPTLGRESMLYGVTTQYVANAERIYFTGQARSGVTDRRYLLGCLKPDGTLDPDFGDNGIASDFFINQAESVGTSLTLLSDGKILLIGRVRGNSVPALARFTSKGTLDPEFGSQGYAILDLPAPGTVQVLADKTAKDVNQDRATSVTPLADGKILVVHTYVVTHLADTRAYVFLLNSDGSYDEHFNGTGFAQVIYPGADPAEVKLRSGFVDQDGTFVVAGGLQSDAKNKVPFMARYARDGKLVPGFGTGGFFAPPHTLFKFAEFKKVIGQPNNRLLGIGSTDDGRGLLISLEADGKYNIQFNGAKPLLTRLDDSITYWTAGAMQPDGKIVLCGDIRPAGESSPGVVARLLDNGSLDATFHGRGWTSTEVNGLTTFSALALQQDGKILVTGRRYGDENQGLILRYHAGSMITPATTSNNEGQPAPAFGTNGQASGLPTTNIQSLSSAGKPDLEFGINGTAMINVPDMPLARVSGVGIGPDKKIYCAGNGEDVTDPNPKYFLGRFNHDGSVDRGFATSGFAQDVYPDFSMSQIKSFTFQPDGKTVIFAVVYNHRGQLVPAFSRYDTQGRLDPSFGTNGQTVLDIELSPPGITASRETSRKIDANPAHPHGVEILPDGKILTSHNYFFDLQQSHGLIIRLDKNGTLDLSFNQIGYIPVIHPDYQLNATVLRNVTVQPDGKYLGCGNVYDDSGKPSPAMFVRYNSSGELDEHFGNNGFVTVADEKHAHLIQATVLQPNQRILGFGDTLGNKAVMISREPDGSPNIQFNKGIPFYSELESGSITSWTSAAIQKNGRIVVAGGIGLEGQADIVVARFIDAAFDKDFNDGQGWLRTRLENGVQLATGLTLQEDGRILICATLPGKKNALLCYHG